MPRKRYRNSVIVASGEYLPERRVTNDDIAEYRKQLGLGKFWVEVKDPEEKTRILLDKKVPRIFYKGREIIYREDHLSIENRVKKFETLGTGVKERRIAADNEVASDLGAKALLDTNYDIDSVDMIIVAHDYADMDSQTRYPEQVPNIATRIKHKAGIKNPKIVATDCIHGCPGSVQADITAHAFLRAGLANTIATISTEILSRPADPYSIEWLLFSDGAGTKIWKAVEDDIPYGFLETSGITDSEHLDILDMGPSCNPNHESHKKFMRLRANELYKYSGRAVPPVLHECAEKTIRFYQKQRWYPKKDRIKKEDIIEFLNDYISMYLAHQMNERMLYMIMEKAGIKKDQIPHLLPIIIPLIANCSDATNEILYNRVARGLVPEFKFHPGDLVMHWAIGAGPHTNAYTYKVQE